MSSPTATKEISSAIVDTLDEPLSSALLTLDKTLASQTQTYFLYEAGLREIAQRS